MNIQEISINPNQPRKTFSDESIEELSETIKVHGLIQPIVVIQKGNFFELVSGERRLRACKKAGLAKIPAIVKNYSEEQSLEIAIIENIQREDLNPIEEALAYQTLIDKLGLKITEVASRLGKNRATISNLVRLLQLPESIKELLRQGKITEGHARPLLSIGNSKKAEELSKQIAEKGLSVREVEEIVSKLVDGEKILTKSSLSQDPSILDMENKIRTKLSAKIKLSHNVKSGKGKIIINYNNLEDMDRILQNMGI